MSKVIFVDRDGVINVDLLGDYIKTPDEFRFEKGAVEALKLLKDAGYKIILISNQAGVGDGIFSEADLEAVNQHMYGLLRKEGVEIDDAYFCLHGKKAGCFCRKPEIGLLEKASENHKFEKTETYFIGDKKTDIEAGLKFGIKTYFVRTGHGVNDEALFDGACSPHKRADSFLDAVKDITG